MWSFWGYIIRCFTQIHSLLYNLNVYLRKRIYLFCRHRVSISIQHHHFSNFLKVTNTTRFLASFRLLHKNHKTDNASVFPVDLCCFTFHSTGLDSTVTKFQSKADPWEWIWRHDEQSILELQIGSAIKIVPIDNILNFFHVDIFNNLCFTADNDILRVGEEAQCHQICEKLPKRLLSSRGPGTGATIVEDFRRKIILHLQKM